MRGVQGDGSPRSDREPKDPAAESGSASAEVSAGGPGREERDSPEREEEEVMEAKLGDRNIRG